jgi:hypothetical protein
MKRTALALTLTLATMFLVVAGTQFVSVTSANPLGPSLYPMTPDTNPPSIAIQMPEHNKTYNENTVPYSITVEKPSSWFENNTIHGTLRSVGYILDEKENVTIADINNPSVSMSVEEPSRLVFTPNPDFIDLNSENRTISFRGNLSGLSEGSHTIQVWVNSVSIYHPPDTPQNFYGWWAAVADYPLETLSNIAHFSIANLDAESEPEPKPEPFPALSAIFISLTIVAGVTVGVLVYFKKRQRGKSS